MKTFGQFIREQRERLKLTQGDIEGFGQSYIADIEGGRINPSRRTTIEKLVRTLQIDPKEYGILIDVTDWLWIYSLLNREPYEVFQRPGKSFNSTAIAEYHVAYETEDEITIHPGEPEQMVLLKLGQPSKKVRIPGQVKWIYEDEGLHITFIDGIATTITFK
jgi:transcriptional regulator with XRE-family HTH domain